MEALECIKSRRSIRKFTAEPVTEAELREIVSAAAYAPSWKNSQIARYVVLRDREKLNRMADEVFMGFTHNTNILKGAPALAALCMVTGRSGFERDGSYSTALAGHWQSFDAGIAAQTFCLAAHAHGLGTVLMGIYDPEKAAALLEIPEGQTVAALIALGHPSEAPSAPARKPVDELLRII